MLQYEKRSKKRLYFTFGAIVPALAGLLLYWREMNVTPQLTIPTPDMPSPNAFDYYCDATAVMVRYDTNVDSGVAFNRLCAGDVQPGQMMEYLDGSTRPATSRAELQHYQQVNAAAFAKLREGFQYEYRQPPIRSFSMDLPYLGRFHDLARLLALDAVVRRSDGDYDGAMTSCLDGLHLGIDMPRGGSMMRMMSGRNDQALVRQQM